MVSRRLGHLISAIAMWLLVLVFNDRPAGIRGNEHGNITAIVVLVLNLISACIFSMDWWRKRKAASHVVANK